VVECPVCQMENPEDAPLCNGCGAYLLGGRGKETELRPVGGVTGMNGEETTGSPSEPSWSGVSNKIFGRMSTRMNREEMTESPSEPSWSGVADNIFGRMSPRLNRGKKDRDS
jgi:hypothetical protein